MKLVKAVFEIHVLKLELGHWKKAIIDHRIVNIDQISEDSDVRQK